MKCFVYIGNDGKQLKVHLPAATWYNWYTQNTVTDSRSTTITMDTPLDMLTSCSKHDTATFGGKRKEKWVAYETAAVFRCFCRTSGAKWHACRHTVRSGTSNFELIENLRHLFGFMHTVQRINLKGR